MDQHGGKIAAGLLCLVVVWIIVFWLWTPAEPPISYSKSADSLPASRVSPPDPPAPSAAPNPKAAPPKAEGKSDTKSPRSSGGGGVLAPEFTDYTIEQGDTFPSLAQKFFGSRSKADLIASANPLVDPTRLKPGRVIRIPKDPSNIQGRPTATPPPAKPSATGANASTYKVVPGDTLTAISRKFYGTIKHTDLILDANRAVLKRAEDLRPGQTLTIPPAPQ
ncbi:MAG: LysM peptidoglycan-binding domain-containing protein [Phycisphaerales bacterium]|nr:LysM peptidoglycan-binding domain-containing protein [Planctomycetota bacterium]